MVSFPQQASVRFLPLLALSLLGLACGPSTVVDVRTATLEMRVDDRGLVSRLRATDLDRDLLPSAVPVPLLQLGVHDSLHAPNAAHRGDVEGTVELAYATGHAVTVRVTGKPTHLRLEIVAVSDLADVDLAVWGPYATVLDESIGETVGVASGDGFTLGLQALNPRTLGGFPWNANDAMPQLDIFEGDPSDLSEEGKRHVLYRVEAAKPDTFGSTLQAYVRERRTERVVPNWGHPAYAVPPFDDAGIVGSAIALFGVPTELTLDTIGAIEIAEGLPHPTIDGTWTKRHPASSAAYVILPFSERTFARALQIVERAGLHWLYHPDPFASWGHFPLRDDHFPGGIDGLRRLVERAEARDIHVGLHTLSNFISTDDPYVTPVPDPRLAVVGETRLIRAVDEAADSLVVADAELFRGAESVTLRAVRLQDEIVQYRAVSVDSPWTLIDVQRGAFGTRPAAHPAGTSAAFLADHAYGVLLGDASLSIEMAHRLAELYNRTGLRQISFDGLEGNRSTGMGNYGEILFTTAWYDSLSADIRSRYIADASRTSHFFWHVYTRMNWGEPWYAGFRESQTDYRLKNQAYFRRNFMPGMLGWFSMRPETSREDIEWMLARSAAFDAGYAFYTTFEALDSNGDSDEILALLGRWERARMAGAFGDEQKRRMEDVSAEFHLEETGDSAWTLVPIAVHRTEYADRERQPGEPGPAVLAFDHPGAAQPLSFILTAAGGAVSEIRMTVDGTPIVFEGVRLEPGQHIVYRDGPWATHVTRAWQVVRSVPADPALQIIGSGTHTVAIEARIEGPDDARLKLEVRLAGAGERVG